MTEVFLDTADLTEIERWLQTPCITGVTTNQKIFLEKAKGTNFEEQANKILQIAYPLPVSLEGPNDFEGVLAASERYVEWGNSDSILTLAKNLNLWDPVDGFEDNVVIKVPMLGNGDGLRAVKALSEKNIKTNVTACMTLNQTFLAACAGATYVSLFYNRMIDWKYSQLDKTWKTGTEKKDKKKLEMAKQYALDTIDNTMMLLEEEDCNTKLIVGSIRSPSDIEDILTVAPHIITIPTKILDQMPFHPATDAALKDFEKAWEEYRKAEKK
jgi:transaldolase